jgi:hypothetical protein
VTRQSEAAKAETGIRLNTAIANNRMLFSCEDEKGSKQWISKQGNSH